MLQTEIFPWEILLTGRERRRFGFIQNFELRSSEFNFPCDQFRVRSAFGPTCNLANHADHVFRSQSLSSLDQVGTPFRREDNLGFSIAIAEVDKNTAAMVSSGIDPTAETDFLSHVRGTQFTA